MLTFSAQNNLAAAAAEQDPNDPIAYTQSYQNDLFYQTDKINFKGYDIEVVEKNDVGIPTQVKISKKGKVEILDLSQTKVKLTQEIEEKINTKYQIDDSKSYQILIQGIKNGKITKKTIKYQKIDKAILRDFEDCEFITLNSAYRIINLGSIFNRITDTFSISGAIKTFGQIMDDIEDGCGVLGNECLNLSQSLNIFLHINSIMASQNFYALGNFIIIDDTIIQQFAKHKPSTSSNHNNTSNSSSPKSKVVIQGLSDKIKKAKKKTSKSSFTKKTKKKKKIKSWKN